MTAPVPAVPADVDAAIKAAVARRMAEHPPPPLTADTLALLRRIFASTGHRQRREAA